jgi:tripeptide aminopeptidase
MNQARLLERFLRYARIDTTAREGTGLYPSSPGQLDLGHLLANELRAAGLPEARQDEFGVVTAVLSPSPGCTGPAIGLCAHLDT